MYVYEILIIDFLSHLWFVMMHVHEILTVDFLVKD